MYGHLTSFPLIGHSVADVAACLDDDSVTGPATAPSGRYASTQALVATDLERFWPSRRGHAFDELCRPTER